MSYITTLVLHVLLLRAISYERTPPEAAQDLEPRRKDTPHPCCVARAHPGHVQLRELDFFYFFGSYCTSDFRVLAPIQAFLLTGNARFRLFESSLAPRWRQRVGVSALAGLQEREASNEGAQMASPLSDHKPLEQPRWARCCQLELLGL